MGLAVSVRGVNGFRLSRKRLTIVVTSVLKLLGVVRKASHHKSRCRRLASLVQGRQDVGERRQRRLTQDSRPWAAELFRENVNGTLGGEIARRAALPPPNAKQPH